MDISYLGSIVQAVTEALPLSSSLHLLIFGIHNIIALHSITGIAGLAYCCASQNHKQCIFAIIRALKELGWTFIKNFTIAPLFYLSSIIIIILLYWSKNLLINILGINLIHAGLVAGIICSIFLFFIELLLPDESINVLQFSKFNKYTLVISMICNVLAVIPGTSRLGCVYTGMRLCGLNRQTALCISFVQGALISSITILIHIDFAALFTLPILICGTLYIIITMLLFALSTHALRILLLLICFYRIIGPALLYINFSANLLN